MNSENNYKKSTRTSSKLFEKSKRLHVNGVSHNIRYFDPYPFVVKASKGTTLIDVDNNEFVDYWMGHWSLILGHSPHAVRYSLKKQIDKGWMFGTVNEQTIKLSETIQKAVPVAEKIRYVTSGTEATMYAVRIARSFTGKKIIAKIDGGWHGYTSDLLKTVNWPFRESESKGLVDEEHIVSIPFNDIEKSLEILNAVRNDLAGVIIEPVLGGGGCIPGSEEYLKAIQEYVHKNNSLFMLDEIVTGFRFRYGCLYPTMNLEPDLITLGKIVGGGLPIGIMCAKKEIMEIANTATTRKTERAYVGGGTFSANPASMTAGFATLDFLKNNKITYDHINSLGDYARTNLSKILDKRAIVTGKGSLFMTHFTKDGLNRVENAEDASRCDTNQLKKYHFELIAKYGIFFLPGKLGAISNKHSKKEIQNLITATEQLMA